MLCRRRAGEEGEAQSSVCVSLSFCGLPMNECVLDWSMENDYWPLHAALPSDNQRKSPRPDHEIVELLWQNGHVVMHSQTHRRTATSLNEIKQCQRHETLLKCGGSLENSTKVVDEEETTSWLQYPLDDSFDKEFYSDFYGLPTDSPISDKIKDVTAEEKFGKYGTEENGMEYILEQSNGLCIEENMMPPKPQVVPSLPKTADTGDIMNFPHFSRPLKTDLGPLNVHLGEKNLENKNERGAGEAPSLATKEASICGSNQVQGQFNVSCCNAVRTSSEKVEDAQAGFSNDRTHNDTHETTVTSSSGGVGCSFGRTGQKSAITKSHKRKGRDADESEFLSEEALYEPMEGNRTAQRSTSARRNRAAEVHNLAERRRRDRINEKMKALQELIPHCNKSDKASMLDEAIKYLKSLQLQLQMMWMGSSMAAMMFPGMQHYMSQMGMGMGHGPMPSVHGPMHLSRVPLVSQSMPSNPASNQGYQASMCPPFVSPVNFQNQMQSSQMPYLGFHRMQPTPQAMNLYGSLFLQQNQTALAASRDAPCDVAAPSESTQNVQTG